MLWISLVALFGFLGCYFVVQKCRGCYLTRVHRRRRSYRDTLPTREEIIREYIDNLPTREEAIPLRHMYPNQPDNRPLPSPPLSLRSQEGASPNPQRQPGSSTSQQGASSTSQYQTDSKSFQQGTKTIGLDTIGEAQQRQRQGKTKQRITDPFSLPP